MTMKELWDNLCYDYDVFDAVMDTYFQWVEGGKPEEVSDYLCLVTALVPSTESICGDDYTISCKCDDGILKLSFSLVDEKEAIMSREYCHNS